MDFFSILTLLGGVGLFLFGMNMMGDSLKNLAGGSLERILEKLTTGKSQATGAIKGFGLGTGVTDSWNFSWGGCNSDHSEFCSNYDHADRFCKCRYHEAWSGDPCCIWCQCR